MLSDLSSIVKIPGVWYDTYSNSGTKPAWEAGKCSQNTSCGIVSTP